MRYRGLFLFFVLFILFILPCDAGTCFSESDCPQCTIVGMRLVKSRVSPSSFIQGSVYPSEFLDCLYESDKEKTAVTGLPNLYDSMEVKVACYSDPAIATQWYNYEKGTGEKPEKTDPSQEYRSAYAGKTRCVQGFVYQKPGETTVYTSRGCGANYSVNGRYLISFSPETRYSYPEGNEPKDVRDRLLASDQEYMDCFAGFNPKPAPATGEKTLHGTITATTENGVVYPLKHAKLTLSETTPEGKLVKLQGVTTDENGGYEFGVMLEKGKQYEIDVEMTYSDKNDYFSIYATSPDSDDNIFAFPHVFTYRDESDLAQDIDLDTIWSLLSSGKNPYGIMYVQFAEALEFYKDYLKEDIHLNLPLKIVAFADQDIFGNDVSEKKAEYVFLKDQGISHIYISRKESIAESELTPINREYHEFSHYMMTNLYGGWPANVVKSDIKSLNHDGYVNPSTTDSWEEGFAQFMSTIIAEHYGYANYGVDGIFGSLDLNWKPWESQGYAEEFAIGGILWDLYDSPETGLAAIRSNRAYLQKILNSPDLTADQRTVLESHVERLDWEEQTRNYAIGKDDSSSLSFGQIWAILKANHPDFTSVYDALVQQYPDKKGDIDDIFEKHGFWKDTNTGNARYDPREPYRDSNRNGTFDKGEYFIDMPSGFGSGDNIPSFDPGTETLGTASNYQRPLRRTTRKMPGYFVKVNNAVPFYTYRMELPDSSGHSYSVTVRNDDGLIYIQVPPESGAKITVTADGVTTGNPLVFTSGQFNENYMASVQQGYYTSHDFKVSGPVPTPPVIPDFSKGSPAGKQSAGFFSAKGPLYDLFIGHSTGRAPVIIPVIIAIISLVIVIYVLKKEW